MIPLRARLSPGWPGPSSASPVLLLLHGYGSNEDDLPGLAPVLPPGIPWAAPRAPLDMGLGGAAWFVLETAPHIDPTEVEAATSALWAWVDANVPPDAPIVTLGFSQGGYMALQLLRTRPDRVAATVVLSGLVSDREQPADAALAESRPPVFWGRGDADDLIWDAMIERMAAWLPAHATLTARVYPGLGHSISEEEMRDVRDFLATTI